MIQFFHDFSFTSTKWYRQNSTEGGQTWNQLSIYSPAPHLLPSVWFDGTDLARPRFACFICLLVMILAFYPWSRFQPTPSWFLFAGLRLITWFYCSCWLFLLTVILSGTDLLPALTEPSATVFCELVVCWIFFTGTEYFVMHLINTSPITQNTVYLLLSLINQIRETSYFWGI